ncbi:ecdysone receptor-like isoform X2 [Condylostylus longicornis]|uniref:ecdysone receptor-like isoform X2 n=1 Tax=Condylostylus longicornis TaxID=2530218 RepID=UPI00244E27FF|nr:ecdysone receptor-like isoform X2 [Condylostylus longicornis]
MMKRRWSNNGGFTLRMFEESSSEVTSSSTLMPSAMTMSPASLGGSPEYNGQDLWLYDDTQYTNHQHSVITSVNGCTQIPSQTTIIPLPSMQTNLNHDIKYQQRSNSANSISSGMFFYVLHDFEHLICVCFFIMLVQNKFLILR